ncbi:MAG: DUF1080 domain-containing protein [Prolixibacteraceae bacterium]|jgi:hypothetical protein|nr:DUF1080 domain-containing protein [Prolixibacteraceae bacterium]
MKNQFSFLSMIVLAATIFFGCAEKQNVLTQQEVQEGWQLLFDGQTLNGWKNYNAPGIAGWSVEEGCLVAAGTGADMTGYIITEKQFDNFELAWDWKIAPEGNSGLMYHVIESEKFKTPYLTGPEYQMLDDVGFPQKVEDWQLTGADYAMYVADTTKKKLSPVGEWNTSRIVFDNGHVEHWLNGEKIVEFEAWTEEWFALKNSGKWNMAPEYGLSETGHISLQDHGSKAWFRNMKIKELPKKEKAAESLFNGINLSGWIAYGTEKWYVEDSLLVCESGPDKGYGYLGTEKYYKNFDLSVDFKQISNGNSGIFFRSTVDGTKVSGWQVEVAPKGHDSGGIYESYGRGWLNQISDEKEEILKPGEWNTMRIKVVGPEVTTWLNGEEMTHLNDSLIGSANGRIALQIHSGGDIKVQWKNLIIQPL